MQFFLFRRIACRRGPALPVFGLVKFLHTAIKGGKHPVPPVGKGASGAGIDIRLGKESGVVAHIVDGFCELFAALFSGVGASIIPIRPSFGAFGFALHLFGKAHPFARFPGVFKAQGFGTALSIARPRILRPADPAAGIAAPKEI